MSAAPGDLDQQLCDAHHRGDLRALMQLYQDAAAQSGDRAARGFFLTHAYIFALDAGAREAEALKSQLVAMGRETDG